MGLSINNFSCCHNFLDAVSSDHLLVLFKIWCQFNDYGESVGTFASFPASLADSACGRGWIRYSWQNISTLPSEVSEVYQECTYQGLQHGEDPGASGRLSHHHFPSMGCGWPGKAASSLEILHAPNRWNCFCGGLGRDWTFGRGLHWVTQNCP